MISLPIVQVRKIELKKSNVPESPKRPVSIVLDSLQVQDGMHSSLSEPSIQVCLLTWNKKIPFFLPLLNFCKMQVTYPKLVRKSWNFLFDKSDLYTNSLENPPFSALWRTGKELFGRIAFDSLV